MHRHSKLIAAAGVLLAFAGTALAQFPFGGLAGGGSSLLLMSPDVQQELKMTEEQITKAKEASQAVREKFKDTFTQLKDTPKEQIREKMQEIMKQVGEETNKALKGVLNADQAKRLKQLEMQSKGAEAFADPEVAKALNFSDEQKEKIKTLRDDASKEMREILQGAQGNFQEAITKMQALRKETQEKITATLTDAQKKSWKEMTGEPFEFKLRRPGV